MLSVELSMQLSIGEKLDVISGGFPLNRFCISSLFPFAQPFRVRESPFHCGQTVDTDVLLASMSVMCAACALVVGLAGLGAWPGWEIIGSLMLSCSQRGPGGIVLEVAEVARCQTKARGT